MIVEIEEEKRDLPKVHFDEPEEVSSQKGWLAVGIFWTVFLLLFSVLMVAVINRWIIKPEYISVLMQRTWKNLGLPEKQITWYKNKQCFLFCVQNFSMLAVV